jgi:hypothetical protein
MSSTRHLLALAAVSPAFQGGAVGSVLALVTRWLVEVSRHQPSLTSSSLLSPGAVDATPCDHSLTDDADYEELLRRPKVIHLLLVVFLLGLLAGPLVELIALLRCAWRRLLFRGYRCLGVFTPAPRGALSF